MPVHLHQIHGGIPGQARQNLIINIGDQAIMATWEITTVIIPISTVMATALATCPLLCRGAHLKTATRY